MGTSPDSGIRQSASEVTGSGYEIKEGLRGDHEPTCIYDEHEGPVDIETDQLLDSHDRYEMHRSPPSQTVSSPTSFSPYAASSSSRFSITPKSHPFRNRKSFSATPTPGNVSSSKATPTAPILEEEWGDDAVIQWVGPADLHADDHSITGDSASSVAAEEAGVSEDDKDAWGRDAMLDWAWSGTEDQGSSQMEDEDVERMDEDEDADEDEEEDVAPQRPLGLESEEQLLARGMPDYSTWELKKLQVSWSCLTRIR